MAIIGAGVQRILRSGVGNSVWGGLTYRAGAVFNSGSSAGPYGTAAQSIGSTNVGPFRRVYCFVNILDTGTVNNSIVSVPTIGGVNCDIILKLGSGAHFNMFLISAMVPTGTTAAVANLTFNLGVTSNLYFDFYTADVSQMRSQLPFASAYLESATSQTSFAFALAAIPQRGAMIMTFNGFAITNGTETYANDFLLTQNNINQAKRALSANNCPQTGAFSGTVSWTGSGQVAVGMFSFR